MAVGAKFRKAQRQKVKAAIMIEGLQGHGKSGLALMIAYALAKPEKIYAIDTENQSLDLFDGMKLSNGLKISSDFNKVDLTADDGFAPSNYAALRDMAIKDGAEVLIMDSISHMWSRKGGLLDTVNEAAEYLDNYRAWGTEKNRKEKDLINELMRSDKLHTIVTVRSKEKFEMVTDETGKAKVQSLGEQQIQQADLKYEPDLVIQMKSPGHTTGRAPVGLVTKSRYAIFEAGTEYEFTAELLDQLRRYLEEGVDADAIIKDQVRAVAESIKSYCNTPIRKKTYDDLKAAAGYKESKIEDIPLSVLKQIYKNLIAE